MTYRQIPLSFAPAPPLSQRAPTMANKTTTQKPAGGPRQGAGAGKANGITKQEAVRRALRAMGRDAKPVDLNSPYLLENKQENEAQTFFISIFLSTFSLASTLVFVSFGLVSL